MSNGRSGAQKGKIADKNEQNCPSYVEKGRNHCPSDLGRSQFATALELTL